jgi:hypothetical protein
MRGSQNGSANAKHERGDAIDQMRVTWAEFFAG